MMLFFIGTPVAGQTISFRVADRTLDVGDATVLRWKVTNTRRRDSLTLTGYEGVVPMVGEMRISPEEDTEYVLTHFRRGKSTTRRQRVRVRYPEINYFSGPDTAAFRAPIGFAWRTTAATHISIPGESEALPVAGTVMLTATAPQTYTLKACNRNQRCVTATHYVEVVGDFARGPSLMRKGDPGMLEWRFMDAVAVTIEGEAGSLPTEGTLRISPSSSTQYTFNVTKRLPSGRDSLYKVVVPVTVAPGNFITGVRSYPALPANRRLVFDVFAVDLKDYPEEIRLKVMVTDTTGLYVSGLAPPSISSQLSKRFFTALIETVAGEESHAINDFSVREVRTRTSLPHDVSLVADYSGSMAAWFKELDEATLEFVKRKNALDRLALVRFDHRIVVEAELAANKNQMMQQLSFSRGQSYGGATALYAAAGEGMSLLTDSNRQRILVLMTDGFENSSMAFWGTHFTTVAEVLAMARNYHITIHTINYRGLANTRMLEALADMTGGKSYLLYHPEEISKVFAELQHLFRNYYEIRYRPMREGGDRVVELMYNNNQGEVQRARANVWIEGNQNITAIEQEGMGSDSLQWMYKGRPILQRYQAALFDFDEAALDSAAMKSLDKIAVYIQRNPYFHVVIQGHSDLVGSDRYCNKISRMRAQAAYDYLRRSGIPASRMTRVGMGKSEPVWSEEDEPWKARENRRAELLIVQ